MTVSRAQARGLARQWVREEGTRLPGFAGAFLTGSTLWAADDEPLPSDSDVDVTLVLDTADPASSPGKFPYRGVLLDVSATRHLGSAETVLADYHLASSFRHPNVLADPTRRLTAVQRVTARHFAERSWVLARCTAALDRVRGFLDNIDPGTPEPDQVTRWLFGTGVTTHVLLVAGLRNPTVRRRYAAVRDLLAAHTRLAYHDHLLALLGCADMTPARVGQHLAALEAVFDTAATVAAPSYAFASDITRAARPVSIDGTRRLIDAGLHREAVFWVVATYCRCLSKLSIAGADPAPHEDAFHDLLADLGAETVADRRRRADRVLAELPELRRQAESLIPLR